MPLAAHRQSTDVRYTRHVWRRFRELGGERNLKHRWNRGLDAGIHFWRDNNGTEFDLVVEHAGLLHAVEIK